MEFSNFDTWLVFLALNSDQTSRLWLESDFRTQSCYQTFIDMPSSSQMLTWDETFRIWDAIKLPKIEMWSNFRKFNCIKISRLWYAKNFLDFNIRSDFETLTAIKFSNFDMGPDFRTLAKDQTSGDHISRLQKLTYDQITRFTDVIKLPVFNMWSNFQTLTWHKSSRIWHVVKFVNLDKWSNQ